MMKNKQNKVLFKVGDDALIVANTGAPFTRKGVISICYSHLSAKSQYSPPVDNYKCPLEKLVEQIRERAIRNYKNDNNLLQEHTDGEGAVERDYSGRVIWELMQNADDAAKGGVGAGLIGEKGLGFKSVLMITEEPEIHSGPFHFLFSSEKTKAVLKENNLAPHQLTFRIPHHLHDPHAESECGSLLKRSYTTVIRLPFRDSDSERKIIKQLNAISVHNLLLCQRLNIIEVAIDGQEKKVFEIYRKENSLKSGRADFAVKTGEQTDSWRGWRWISENPENEKRLSVAIFLPFEDKRIIACDTAHPLHVFFPTQEEIGIKALIHASFDLEMNREHLAKEQVNESDLISATGQLVGKIFQDESTSLSAVSEIFGGVVADVKNDNPRKDRMWPVKESIVKAIEETAFVPIIGGQWVKPSEVKLWKHKLGDALRNNSDEIMQENLLAPEFNKDESVRSMLEKFGAKEIDTNQHAELLRYCRHDSMDDCLRALKVANAIMMWEALTEERSRNLCHAPFWWTYQEQARAFFDGSKKALLQEKPNDWPAWLPIDSLSRKFQEQIKNLAIANRPWRGKSQFRDKVMLPFLEEKENDAGFWQKNRASVLRWVMAWSSERSDQPILVLGKNNDDARDRLARLVRVPTGKGWLPAFQCYAGKSWEGPEAFDKYFNSVESRELISPLEEWPAEIKEQEDSKEKWKGLLRFLGVSYELKVTHFDIRNPPPEISDQITSYKEQCLHEIQNRHSSAYLVSGGYSVFIEHFPKAIAECSPSEIYQMIKSIYDYCEAKSSTEVTYYYQMGERPLSPCSSFVDFQLRSVDWIPCKPALLHDSDRIKPGEAYMPDSGLGGLLSEIDKKGVDEDDWHGESGIKKMLGNLGVESELPSNPEEWYKLMRVLARPNEATAREMYRWSPKNNKRGLIAKAAYAIFEKYRKKFKDRLPPSVPVPFLRQDKEGEFLAFAPAREVLWADKPYLTDPTVKNAILQKEEIKTFFLTLKQGAGFGLESLSNILELRPDFGDINPEESKKLMERYRERHDILNLIASCELPKDISICVRRKMRLRSQKYRDIVPDVESWYDSDNKILYVCATDQRDNLAYGLAKIIEKDRGGDFCFMLAKKSREKCIESLRKRYSYSQEALERLETRLGFSGELPVPATADDGTGEPQSASDLDKSDPSQNAVTVEANIELEPSINTDRQNGAPKPSSHTSTREPTHENRPDSGRNNRAARQGSGSLINPTPGWKAEEWLEGKLKKHEFDVTRTGKGSDYKVCLGSESALVEIKHMEGDSGQIYWSQRQIEDAKRCRQDGENYFVAIVRGDEENRKVFWFWNPLDDFIPMDRACIWEQSAQGIDMDAEMEWYVPEPSANISWKEPMYKVRVKLDSASLSGEGDIVSACEQLKSELKNRCRR